MPPYIILSDATLVEIATYLPQSLDEMRLISGFGDIKLARYGRQFLSQQQRPGCGLQAGGRAAGILLRAGVRAAEFEIRRQLS